MHHQSPQRKSTIKNTPTITKSTKSTKSTNKVISKRKTKKLSTSSKRFFGKSKLERNGFQPYDSKIMSAAEAVEQFLIPSDQSDPLVLGCSGFTGVSNPKAIPQAIIKHVDDNNLAGKIKYDLFVGASSGPDLDNEFASRHLIYRRMPFCAGKTIQKAINNSELHFLDQHLSTFGDRLLTGHYHGRNSHKPRRGDEPQIDVAVIEASSITSNGDIIPSLSLGLSCELAQTADKIIIELNKRYPSTEGLHDITQYRPIGRRHPYPLLHSEDRIGDPFISINSSRVVAVVETDSPDFMSVPNPPDTISQAISGHLLEFLEHEIAWGRIPKDNFHIQSGVGSIADKVIAGFGTSNIDNIRVYTEVLQDSFLPLIKSGKIIHASTTGVKLSQPYMDDFYNNFDFYKRKVIVRNQTLSNAPEILSRIGLISINTPVECNIYGNINSSHVGSSLISGIGGSNDMTRSALLSIMHSPSTRPTKTDPHGISCIVPQVTSSDTSSRDLQVFVTENGLADLRGLSPIQRAREIINKTAHPVYQDQLTAYLEASIAYNRKRGALDTPHLFKHAYDMHVSHEENGTMRLGPDWLKF